MTADPRPEVPHPDHAARYESLLTIYRSHHGSMGSETVLRVAELHAPIRPESAYPTCDGCDPGAYAEDPPEWPCRTWLALEGEEVAAGYERTETEAREAYYRELDAWQEAERSQERARLAVGHLDPRALLVMRYRQAIARTLSAIGPTLRTPQPPGLDRPLVHGWPGPGVLAAEPERLLGMGER